MDKPRPRAYVRLMYAYYTASFASEQLAERQDSLTATCILDFKQNLIFLYILCLLVYALM